MRRYSAKTAANAFFPFGRGDAWERRPRGCLLFLYRQHAANSILQLERLFGVGE